jgi:CRP-like cAMP-binding protein
VARDDREALPLDGSPRLPPPPLDAETIALVEASAPRLTLNTGEWLARVDQTEGWRKATAWLISEGSVAVVSRAGEVVVEIGAGGLVGELTVLTGLPRTADLRAASPCVLRPLRRADLTSLVRLRPELGVILATRLATALHNRSVAARVATGPSRLPPVPSEGSAVR